MRLALRFIAALALITKLAGGQIEPPKNVERWNTIDHLCDDLLHIQSHTGRDSVAKEHMKALKNVVLKLYERGAAACCEGTAALAEVETTRGGKFNFADVKPGAYWLVGIVAGREYKLPLRLELSKGASTQCSDQQFGIYDSGDFQIRKIITVD